MREISTAAQDAKEAARSEGIAPLWFFYAVAKDWDTGGDVAFGFYTGDWTITASVLDGSTGVATNRDYVGGVNLEIGSIPRRSDNNYAPVDVAMSAIADPTQDFFRGHDVRLAYVEIHSVDLDPTTRLPVGDALLEFIGVIDSGPVETAPAGGESMVKFGIVDEAVIILTRTNPRKRSHEGQKRRQGDEFGKHSNSVRLVELSWGE